MRRLLTRLVYICVGIFVVADLAFRLQLPTSPEGPNLRPKLERRPSVSPTPGAGREARRPTRRQPGPKFWVKETNHWAAGGAVSKRHEFPGYNDPVNPVGVVDGRTSEAKTTVGSAFAIAPNGLWLTARHVVEGCREVLVQAGLRNGRPVSLRSTRVTMHPTADVALIASADTDFEHEPFALADRGDLAGEAFHIGFPRGKPGAAHSRFLGRKRVRHRNVRGSDEEILVWAEVSRLPDFSGGLGGISGGVVVDRTGAVIGTNSAGNPRRGRILTSRPKMLWEAVRQGRRDARPATGARPAITELTTRDYPAYAKAAIQDRRVVRVICVRRK